MLNVSELLNDPDFAQAFTILRSQGAFVQGGYSENASPVPGYGVITVAKERDLVQVPEGDRVSGALLIYSTAPLYLTKSNPSGVSDTITWRGESYRLAKLWPYADFGYYKALAVRTSGA